MLREKGVVTVEWNIIIGAACAIVGAALSYIALSRNKSKDDQAAGRQDGTILSELGYIKASTDEIKNELKEQRRINNELYSRMSAVESSAKQAHKRLDRIEGREEREV